MAKTTTEYAEYTVSARVVLGKGDLFRATGGPYYVTKDATGKKVKSSMAAKGPFRFISYNERGQKKWIVAWSVKEHATVVLPLTRWRTIELSSFVNRPYRITGNKRPPKRRKS
jgi:hypothetical protein